MCSDAGQAMIAEDIERHRINRVVIGACAPSLHEKTFRGTVARAGLNPYLYLHVGIREQVSWVHRNDPEAATAKAIRLMAAGVAKVRLLEPLEPISLEARKHALVIGGGIAGLRAAWDIARRGIEVTLIEKSPFLGGRVAQLERVFPDDGEARSSLHTLIENVKAHPLIHVLTRAELVGMRGYVGDFYPQIRLTNRGVSESFKGAEQAMAACPVEVPDEFNYGLTMRKALYRAYPGCYPPTPAIDWEHCTGCGDCLHVNGKGLDLKESTRDLEINVGAVVVATGFRPYQPHPGEYGFGEFPEVITLPQLIRLLALSDDRDVLTYRDRPVRSLALVHCVGSRQVHGVHEPQPDGQINDYCSRVCCTATLHAANELRQRFPELNIFDVHQDVRTYGRGHEEIYLQAAENGTHFLRFHGDETPEVRRAEEGEPHALLLRVKDYLTWGEELEVPVDLVVLAVGMMPEPVEDLIDLLKISPGTDRFLLEVHPKLRPVETAVPGVVLAGTAQGPMNIQESCAAASAAAAKVAVLLGQGQVELEPFVAKVNPERCTSSGECMAACTYEDAIALETFAINGTETRRAVVTPANCAGCGICVSACPNRAIDLQGWTLEQYEAMVEAIAVDLPVAEEIS
jgi:heterodisulfide reductase subunit A